MAKCSWVLFGVNETRIAANLPALSLSLSSVTGCGLAHVALVDSLTWDAFWYSRPRPVLADGRGVVRLLELRQTVDVDRLAVRDA